MKLKFWAYLFLSPGFDRSKQTAVLESSQTRMKAIGFDRQEQEQAIEVAKELVEEGVQMIELCGGFGPLWAAKISEAIHLPSWSGSSCMVSKLVSQCSI